MRGCELRFRKPFLGLFETALGVGAALVCYPLCRKPALGDGREGALNACERTVSCWGSGPWGPFAACLQCGGSG